MTTDAQALNEGLESIQEFKGASIGWPPAKADPTLVPAINEARTLGVVMGIPVSVRIVLGSTRMSIASLVKLGRGSVIPLDRKVGEPVDVMVNDRIVARGEVVFIDEKAARFGVSLTEIVREQVDSGEAHPSG